MMRTLLTPLLVLMGCNNRLSEKEDASLREIVEMQDQASYNPHTRVHTLTHSDPIPDSYTVEVNCYARNLVLIGPSSTPVPRRQAYGGWFANPQSTYVDGVVADYCGPAPVPAPEPEPYPE